MMWIIVSIVVGLLGIVVTGLVCFIVGCNTADKDDRSRIAELENELKQAERQKKDMVETWTRRLNKLTEEKESIKNEILTVLKQH
jgi:Mg2+/citrate symporter